MKAFFIQEFGHNEVVQLGERPVPVIGSRELLVEVRAAGVNPVDFKIREGGLQPLVPYRFPLVLGNELSGVVVEVGPEVTKFKKGDAIFARLDKLAIGAFAQFAVVKESDAALKPENLSFEEAASIPLVGLTTWQVLIELGGLKAGQKALIHAGSGGVGTFAIQLAKHLGATVATTVGQRNVALVKGLGADEVIDYGTQRFDEVLRDCDFVFDTLAGETQHRSFRVLKPGGVMVSIAGMPTAKFARAWGVSPLVAGALGLLGWKTSRLAKKHGVRFEYLFMRPDGQQLSEIARLLARGVIRPVLDRVFPFEQTPSALQYVESGRAVGKVVIQVKPRAAAAGVG
ncbi:MAG TPA: NADP-dependent oxidoreductase [Myxococcaceae bacterium]|nr:NADP-dependent oxidoreductase [Myxococcaceae bacterium]